MQQAADVSRVTGFAWSPPGSRDESEAWEESKGPRSAVEKTNQNQSLQMGHSSFDAEIS